MGSLLFFNTTLFYCIDIFGFNKVKNIRFMPIRAICTYIMAFHISLCAMGGGWYNTIISAAPYLCLVAFMYGFCYGLLLLLFTSNFYLLVTTSEWNNRHLKAHTLNLNHTDIYWINCTFVCFIIVICKMSRRAAYCAMRAIEGLLF